MSEDIYSMTKSGFREAIRQAKESAWDEGRESIALDFTRPLKSDGTREASKNPYRSGQ